jgi:hypothetical protein
VTSLKSLRFLKGKLESPYVVSCFFNSLLAPQLKWVIIQAIVPAINGAGYAGKFAWPDKPGTAFVKD